MGGNIGKAELVYTIEKTHLSNLRTVCLTNDNHYFVSGSADKAIMLWETHSGNLLYRWENAHNDVIFALIVTADDKYIISGSKDMSIKFWDIKSKNQEYVLEKAHNDTIFCMAMSSHGQYFASGSGDKSLKIWETEKKTVLTHFEKAHNDTIFSLAFTKDTKFIVTGSKDMSIKIWNFLSKVLVHTFEKAHGDSIFALALSHDNRWIISGSNEEIKLWDIHQRRFLHQFGGAHDGMVFGVAITRDNRYLISVSGDNKIKVWDLKDVILTLTIDDAHNGKDIIAKLRLDTIFTMALSKNDRYLITGSRDQSIKVWDMQPKTVVETTLDLAHADDISSCCFTKDNKYIIYGDHRHIKIFDYKSKEIFEQLSFAHDGPINAIVEASIKNFLISGSEDKSIKLWDVQQKNCIHVFEKAHEFGVKGLYLTKNERFLVSHSLYDIKIWDFNIGSCIRIIHLPLDAEINQISVSPDERTMVSVGKDTNFRTWDLYSILNSPYVKPEPVVEKPNDFEEIELKLKKSNAERDKARKERDGWDKRCREIQTEIYEVQDLLKKRDRQISKDLKFIIRDISNEKNSLFECFAYAFEDMRLQNEEQRKRLIKSLRKLISATVLMELDSYTEEDLQFKSPTQYSDSIEEEDMPGGKLELKILSAYYKTMVWLFDYSSGELKTKFIGEEEYEHSIFLKYEEERYAIIVANTSSKQDKGLNDVKVFPSGDSSVKYRIFGLLQTPRGFENQKSSITNEKAEERT